MPAPERTLLARRALQRRYMLIYRTLADPRALDPTLDPSERPLGSIFSFGRDPLFGNYGEGLGRVMSARGWLSTWSGLSSNAALERTLPEARADAGRQRAADRTSTLRGAPRSRRARLTTRRPSGLGAEHHLRPVGGRSARPPDARAPRSRPRAGPMSTLESACDRWAMRIIAGARSPSWPRRVSRHASRRHDGARFGAAGGQRDPQRHCRRPPDGGVSNIRRRTSRPTAPACSRRSARRACFSCRT